jgi:GTP cyclohydrolase FolE2
MYENALFIEEIAKNVSEKLQKYVNERHIKHYLVKLSQKESINTYETLVKIEYGEK